ncbi:hypothetical protein K2173_024472 [Erythroxylum novogranatense]|uniref:Uncharacterized protein n=1 Tax=Erythroxylum novogranatense TaxID=1862640 RepID=A0AAV8SUJ0_9ROSI|nr:hypothetical protein K2173_024472 [Erythroxylum novogranatense]
MEANRERREELEKKEALKDDSNGSRSQQLKKPSTTGFDPITKQIIRESIVSGSGQLEEDSQNPDDVLVFSRSVEKIDSSLE